jgi:hypothetical protein
MDEETYTRIPETLGLREIRYNIVDRDRRTKTIDVITTPTNAHEYRKEDNRWLRAASTNAFQSPAGSERTRWPGATFSRLDIRQLAARPLIAALACASGYDG